jgi:hypothetical protein
VSARVLRAWRGEHGDWCSGYQRPGYQRAIISDDMQWSRDL